MSTIYSVEVGKILICPKFQFYKFTINSIIFYLFYWTFIQYILIMVSPPFLLFQIFPTFLPIQLHSFFFSLENKQTNKKQKKHKMHKKHREKTQWSMHAHTHTLNTCKVTKLEIVTDK